MVYNRKEEGKISEESRIMTRTMEMLDSSTCNFMAVETIGDKLLEKGFKELFEYEEWQLEAGGKYFV